MAGPHSETLSPGMDKANPHRVTRKGLGSLVPGKACRRVTESHTSVRDTFSMGTCLKCSEEKLVRGLLCLHGLLEFSTRCFCVPTK